MNSLGTRLFTMLRGELVGSDAYGNRYYQDRRTVAGRPRRRWVMFDGDPEASKVPPLWHAWLHRQIDHTPCDDDDPGYDWEQPHHPNTTGSPAAWRPAGHPLASGQRPPATGDYEPWRPA